MVMVPARAGGRMGGCETTPPDSRTDPGNQRPQRTPRPRQTTTQQAFLTFDHRPPLAGVKLVRPRPRPDGRTGCGRSSPDPGPRGGTKPAAARKTQHNSQSPGDYQVTGSGQHALLTEKAPMGGPSAPLGQSELIIGTEPIVGRVVL